MSRHAVIQKLEQKMMKQEMPQFNIGDTVKVHTRVVEGDKERIQMFTGTVIARKGTGISETFSVHRVAYGVGMERVFPLHSPRIAKVEVMKEGRVRRAKLYYLRGTSGKKSKVKGKLFTNSKKIAKEAAQTAARADAKADAKADTREAAVESTAAE